MQKENPIKAEKRNKLNQLKELGVDLYPHNFTPTHFSADLLKSFDHLEAGEALENEVVTLSGRIMTRRDMGKASFFNIQDQQGPMQIYVKLAELSEKDQKVFKLSDIGDIVGVTGHIFKTKKGQLSIRIKTYTMLCKTLEPLPEKYHGIADVEIKYRYRHLDLIMDPKAKEVFTKRSMIIKEIRNYLDNKGFLEVETPVLQPIYGGAAAYPFSTHHRSLDMTLYLKISPELYLKRLIVGGYNKVYEVSKNFRNEGIDRSHNPEFLLLEYYEAYTDYEYQMKQFRLAL